MSTIITHSIQETHNLSKKVLRSLAGRNVIALHGELGSGKTTFSQGIGKALGITSRMVSPTFIIVKKYDLPSAISLKQFDTLYHIDLYRIGKPEEVVDLGILDFLHDQKNIVVIEWAEKMGEYMPYNCVDMTFEYIDEEKRKITVEHC